jgi:hypothetical protein
MEKLVAKNGLIDIFKGVNWIFKNKFLSLYDFQK